MASCLGDRVGGLSRCGLPSEAHGEDMKDLEWLAFGAAGAVIIIVMQITLSLALEALRGIV